MAGPLLPIPSLAVPTLILGRDALPRVCPHCGSRALEHARPFGNERFGTIACLICGTTVAYAQAALPAIGSVRARHVPLDALPPADPAPRARAGGGS